QVEKSLAAYRKRDGHSGLPFAVVPRILNMIDPACVEEIAGIIRAAETHFGLPAGLAVFDTWSKGIAAGGGSEDKAQDQNAAAATLRKVMEQFPTLHCLTIGHTGKDTAKGERGSNATMGDRDVGVLITANDQGLREMKIDYANDLPNGERLTLFKPE